MPRIDPNIITHNIVLILDAKPMKKKIRKKNPKIAFLVKDEIEKLLDVGFICPIDYSSWNSKILLPWLNLIIKLGCALIFEVSIRLL